MIEIWSCTSADRIQETASNNIFLMKNIEVSTVESSVGIRNPLKIYLKK